MNRKRKALWTVGIILFVLVAVMLAGALLGDSAAAPDFGAKNLRPSTMHFFGTDWLGRDMLARTLKGLSVSIVIGVLASSVSALIALLVGILAGVAPKAMDNAVNWCIDLVMGIPHIILLILISFVLGRGIKGVVVGIAVTHWPSLARLIRSEVLSLKNEHYIQLSKRLGKSPAWILKNHFLPHLGPQFVVGQVLLFPHAILHEAAITFLGFGLSPEQPAVGIILSESMKYLTTGMWWLAFFPGLTLVVVVLLFDKLGNALESLSGMHSSHHRH